MTPRISVIGASIRKLFESIGNNGDPYWDNVVLASHFDTKDDLIWNRTVLALHGNQADPYWGNTVLAMHMDTTLDGDPYWGNTVLAMHMDGVNGSTTFTDVKGKTITAVGNVQISTAQSKFGGASAYFDGTGDHLTIPASADFGFGTGEFTVEAWVHIASNPSTDACILNIPDPAGGVGFYLRILTTGEVKLTVTNGGIVHNSATPSPISNGVWHHVAVVYKSNTYLQCFLDGVSFSNYVLGFSLPTPTSACFVGAKTDLTSYFTGYIDDLRITKGVARYTANFTPPSSTFSNFGGSVTYFQDEKGKTVTAVGNVVLSSDQAKFGGYSAYFGGNGDYLTVPYSADFAFGTGDFTIECWWRTTNIAANQAIVGNVNLQATPFLGWVLRYDPTVVPGGLRFVSFAGNADNESDVFQFPFVPTNGTWYHIVVQRQNNEFAFIVDGVCIGTGEFDRSIAIASASTRSLLIGAQDSTGAVDNFLVGNIDDLRITKGIARYPIVAPTGDPYWDVVAVSLHMDGTQGGTTFTEDKGGSVTRTGNTITATNIKRFGTASAFFDGTGDYLTVADNANLDLGNAFTIECWGFLTALPTSGNKFSICQRWGEGVNKRSYYLNLENSGGTYQLWGGISADGINAIHVTGNFTPKINQWVHYAFVYTGTELLLFANGNLLGTSSTSVIPLATDIALVIGASWDGISKFWQGYIEDFRITKAAKYRSSFVPRIASLPNVQGFEGTKAGNRIFFPKTYAFRDSATSPLVIDEKGKIPSIAGSVSLDTTTKKFGDASISFNGTTDYLAYAASTDFGFETSDFCIEFWLNTADTDGIICDWRNVLAEPFCAIGLVNGKVGIWNGGAIVGGTAVVNTSTWIHISAVRYRGYITVYVDGNSDSVAYIPDNLGTTRSFRIGADISGASFFAGYLDDFRVTKKASRYIGEFTPSPYPYLEPNNKPWFLEETGKSLNPSGDTKISSVQRFGSGASYFDGHNDRFTLPVDASFNMQSDDFTVELWVYRTGNTVTSSQVPQNVWILLDARINGVNEIQVNARSDNNLIYIGHNSSVPAQSAFEIALNTWYHIALVRNNGLISLYINGVSVTSFTFTGTVNFSGASVGGRYDYAAGDLRGFQGYIDDLRITKGVARYLTTFTPPQKTFSNYKAKYFDPYWGKVVLGMHMDGINDGSTFTDVTGKTITRVGALTKTAVKKFGTASAYFDGVDDYLQVGGAPLLPATTDWTMECWIYRSVAGVAHQMYSQGDAPILGRTFFLVESTNQLNFFVGSTVNLNLFSTSNIPAATWTHVAATRSGNTFRMFINGKLEGSGVLDQAIDQTSLNLIGKNQSAALPRTFNGYIDDFRITSGVARYIEDFQPMQLPFPEKAFDPQPIQTDEYFNNVVLGMHMDGADNGTTFTDITGKSVTASGAVTKTAVKKFGTASAYFDGDGDYLKIPMSSDFDMGSGDFTIEFWYWPINAVASNRIILTRDGDLYPGIYLAHYSATQLLFLQSVNGTSYYGSGITFSITQNVWQHIAIVKSSGLVKAYLNGTDVGINYPVVGSMYYSSSDYMVIGGQTSGRTINGYIDNLRITKGVARYTANFTPPTQFPDSYILKDAAFANTVLLMHMDGDDNGTVFTDVKGKTITVNGNTVTKTATKKFGTASAYFDGAGDYLTLTPSSSFDFSSVDFTVECWINPTSVSAIQVIATCRNSGTGDGWLLFISASGAIGLQGTTGSPSAVSSAVSAVKAGEWSHIAACKSGSTTYVFVNGALVASGVIGIGPSASETLYIGRHHLGAGYDFYGYIDDLRITKGVGRYLEAFTPPRRHPDN